MREVKFKALAEHHNSEEEWFFYTTRTGKVLTDMYVNNKIKRWIVEDSQYIGRKDKNGKEIYGGDILEWGTDKLEVVWGNIGWDLKSTLFRKPVHTCGVFNTLGYLRTSEVIGNVYENPELVKQ